eukprot:6145900-Karenia_brevis.AAC.1
MGKNAKWTCSQCNSWSWGDRESCFRCKAPKPKSGAAASGSAAKSSQGNAPRTVTVGDFILAGNNKKERRQA